MTDYGLTRYGYLWHIINPDRGWDDLSLCGLRLIPKRVRNVEAEPYQPPDDGVCSNCRAKAKQQS